MTTFIFYTDEGYTIAPNNEELNNLQVLGFEEGGNKGRGFVQTLRKQCVD